MKMYVLWAVLLFLAALFAYMIIMPGKSFTGEPAPLRADDLTIAARLKEHVSRLCAHPAGRNYVEKQGLDSAKRYISDQFRSSGYAVEFQDVPTGNYIFANIEAELGGGRLADQIVVVGAHYDAVIGAPGANDNGSGVAALLELAKSLRGIMPARTLRFVAFVNEEPPHTYSDSMGSVAYARRSKERGEKIVAMFSLETIGYYRNHAGSQRYPLPLSFFYPNTGNFIAFVGNLRSRSLVTEAIGSFRAHAQFPSEGIAAPAFIPGIGWSDHWSFWQQGYQAVMITDTALYRYPHYHRASDTPDKVDYELMVPLVSGLVKMLEELAKADH